MAISKITGSALGKDVIMKDVATADGSSPTLTLQTGDTNIEADDVLGTINFQAPDEGTGTDAILVAAGMSAISEGDFSASSNATSLVFKTGASAAADEKMRIDSTGRVGLNTNAPLHVLDIDADVTGSIPTDHAMGTSTENSNYFGFHNTNNSATFSGLSLETRTSGAARWLIANEWKDTYKGDLVFRTRDGGSTSSEVMRIDNAGRVMIGNSTAIAAGNAQYSLLSVRGGTDSANSAGSLSLASGLAAASLSDTNGTGLISFGDAEGRETAYIISSMDGTPSASNSSGDLEFWTTPASSTTPSRKLTIDLDGDVLLEGTEKTTVNHTDGSYLVKTLNDGNSNVFSTSGHGLEGSVRDGNGLRHSGVRVIRVPGTGGGISSGSGIGIFTSGNTFAGYNQTRNNSLTFWAAAFYFAPYNDGDTHLGDSSYKWQNIYATNSSIQTSDQREKQQIASLTDGEINAAKAISKLFKTYKWNKVVEVEGDGARIHTGAVAQEVAAALEAQSLDPWRYAFLTKDIWWEDYVDVPAKEEILDADGKSIQVAQDATQERVVYKEEDDAPEGSTRKEMMGIRYPELLSFVGAATEQRLTSIETRLTALEAE